jgi:hypothetical protein
MCHFVLEECASCRIIQSKMVICEDDACLGIARSIWELKLKDRLLRYLWRGVVRPVCHPGSRYQYKVPANVCSNCTTWLPVNGVREGEHLATVFLQARAIEKAALLGTPRRLFSGKNATTVDWIMDWLSGISDS